MLSRMDAYTSQSDEAQPPQWTSIISATDDFMPDIRWILRGLQNWWQNTRLVLDQTMQLVYARQTNTFLVSLRKALTRSEKLRNALVDLHNLDADEADVMPRIPSLTR